MPRWPTICSAAMAQRRGGFHADVPALGDAAGGCDGEDGVARAVHRSGRDRRLAARAGASGWRAKAGRGGARRPRCVRVNPAFIPRNHLVEEALAAAEGGDFGPFEMLLGVLATPFDDQPGKERYALPPRPEEVVHQTFCGT